MNAFKKARGTWGQVKPFTRIEKDRQKDKKLRRQRDRAEAKDYQRRETSSDVFSAPQRDAVTGVGRGADGVENALHP